jgi:hypothetical protein
LKINNIEKEKVVDTGISSIWKHAIELSNTDAMIDNYKFEYK